MDEKTMLQYVLQEYGCKLTIQWDEMKKMGDNNINALIRVIKNGKSRHINYLTNLVPSGEGAPLQVKEEISMYQDALDGYVRYYNIHRERLIYKISKQKSGCIKPTIPVLRSTKKSNTHLHYVGISTNRKLRRGWFSAVYYMGDDQDWIFVPCKRFANTTEKVSLNGYYWVARKDSANFMLSSELDWFIKNHTKEEDFVKIWLRNAVDVYHSEELWTKSLKQPKYYVEKDFDLGKIRLNEELQEITSPVFGERKRNLVNNRALLKDALEDR